MEVHSKKESRLTCSRKRKPIPPEAYTVQCHKCLKWRKIESYDEYEVIQSKKLEEPYVCEKKGMSCETWVVDKPGVPKSPTGFKRTLVVRKDNTRVDVYYMTPCNKRLRSFNDAAAFIKANQAYKDVPLKDFDFRIPKVINDVSAKPSKKRDNTEQSKEDNGTMPFKEDDGTEPYKEDEGIEPSKEDDSTEPSKEDDGTEPLKKDDNTEPSEDDDIIRAYLRSLWC